MGGGGWEWLVALLTAALVSTAAAQGSSSGGIPTCATKLAPCAEYLNATKTPPESCCSPLKEAVTKERACLCNIYDNPALLKALQINVTQILGLPKLCNIDIGSKDPKALCKGVAQSPSSSPTGSAQKPPAETGSTSTSTGSGSGSGSGGSNGATNMDKSTRTRLLAGVLVFCAYVMFY